MYKQFWPHPACLQVEAEFAEERRQREAAAGGQRQSIIDQIQVGRTEGPLLCGVYTLNGRAAVGSAERRPPEHTAYRPFVPCQSH